jgi:hypothetical protein
MLSERYKKSYGVWAGDRVGHAPDFTRCCTNLHDRYHPGGYQCTRKRGYGPDEAYCKQHDPEAVARRAEASKNRYDKQWNQRRLELSGPRFFAVLKQIAEGHNDPRSIAQEAIAPHLSAGRAALEREARE